MYFYKEDRPVKTYIISSSLKAPSCRNESLGTPWGLHSVCEIIGNDQPLGMVFKGRKPIGSCFWECDEVLQSQNLITSRILRLVGLENGLNLGDGVDTFKRFVYLHGTNHENKLGSPASSGCLQVSNHDAVELAELIPINSHLYITLK